MARALSISELCDDTRDPTTTASQKDTSLAYLETQLRLAKEKGVYLNLSEEKKASERHREVVLRFLEEFGGLEGVGRGLAAVGEGCTTEVDEDNSEDEDEDDEPENDEGDDDEKDGSEHDEDQDDDDYDYLFRRTIISPTAHVEITRLKRKGFHFNPICFYCKIQFDADDNPDGCCKSHTQELSGDFNHEYFADCDMPELEEYDGREPEAWFYGCCGEEGDGADAPPCRVGRHKERSEARPRYT